MTEALLAFSPIAGHVEFIKEKALNSEKDTTLLSLLMQAVEQRIVEEAIKALKPLGWQFEVPISDAILLRPLNPSLLNNEACERARVTFEGASRKLLGRIGVKVKIEHYPTGPNTSPLSSPERVA